MFDIHLEFHLFLIFLIFFFIRQQIQFALNNSIYERCHFNDEFQEEKRRFDREFRFDENLSQNFRFAHRFLHRNFAPHVVF